MNTIMRGQHVSITPPAVGFVLFAVLLCYRLTGLSYRSRGQELVIRNYFRTRHVPVSQIKTAGHRPGQRRQLAYGAGPDRAGPVPIDVISVLGFALPWPTAAQLARLEQHRRALSDWIALAKTQGDPGSYTG